MVSILCISICDILVVLKSRDVSTVGLVIFTKVILVDVVESIMTSLVTLAELLFALRDVCNDLTTVELTTTKSRGTGGGTLRILEAKGDDATLLEIVEDSVSDLSEFRRLVTNVFLYVNDSCGVLLIDM